MRPELCTALALACAAVGCDSSGPSGRDATAAEDATATTPEATTPDATTPDATTPDATTPDATTPDATTPDATQGDSQDDTDYGDVDYTIPTAPAPAIRRLSARELAHSYQALVGLVPDALGKVPPDPRDHTFDRMVNAQTVSGIHLEAYDDAAREAADRLLAERRLDALGLTCPDAILPPAALATTSTTTGMGLAAYPDWALVPGDGNPDRLLIRYAPDCGASLAIAAPEDGVYRLDLEVELNESFDVSLTIDGDEVASWTTQGALHLTYDATLTAGTHLIQFDFHFVPAGNPYVWLQALDITGPIDLGLTRDAAERATCLASIVDTLTPRAFRRPLTTTERDRLTALHATALAAGGTWGEATRLVLRAILGSPKFLYLIETGTPVAGAPGRFALDDWAIAARLAYAICEMPPDATLTARAAAGTLHEPADVRAEAERLMNAPCAEETLGRFYRQWLWLERLPQTAKDPSVYPEFSSALALAMAAQADRFLHDLTFGRSGGSDAAPPGDARALFLRPLAAPAASSGEAPLSVLDDPPTLARRGLLMLPGVLAVTGKFAQTSPVIRGKYVLEQLLCDDLPSPPVTVDTTPPPLDPNLTTRERWAEHSDSDSCRPCHERIDPIGFTFEHFDAMGRYRADENGLPIDARGSALALGIDSPSLDGVEDLAAAIADSERAPACLARQWLRFALGRLDESPDAAAVAEVAAALRGTVDAPGSLRAGFIALTGTTAFTERLERTEAP